MSCKVCPSRLILATMLSPSGLLRVSINWYSDVLCWRDPFILFARPISARKPCVLFVPCWPCCVAYVSSFGLSANICSRAVNSILLRDWYSHCIRACWHLITYMYIGCKYSCAKLKNDIRGGGSSIRRGGGDSIGSVGCCASFLVAGV